MISRDHIESILKVNGVPPSSDDDIIRSVLLSARYNNDEVDTAIMVLREDAKTRQTRVDGLHKVFHTNDSLNSAEISDLLGIDVDLSHVKVQRSNTAQLNYPQIFVIWISSIFIAAVGILLYLYSAEMGPFAVASEIGADEYYYDID